MAVYLYARTFEALVYSVDCSMVSNPSALPVWILAGSEIMKIPGGGTVHL